MSWYWKQKPSWRKDLITYNSHQFYAKNHCQVDKRSVQRYRCWVSITTTNWWNSLIIKSYWKQCSFRFLRRFFWGSWQTGQMAFYDVRVFNTNAKRFVNQVISKNIQTYWKRKEEVTQWANHRNWTWKFYSTVDASCQWNGSRM